MILIIFIISLWTIGLFVASEDGHLLERPKKWLVRISRDRWWIKPLIACVFCMPSIHGLLINILFAFNDGFTWWLPVMWLVTSVCAVAVNSILWPIIRILRMYMKWFQEQTEDQPDDKPCTGCPEANDIKIEQDA